MSAMPRSLAWGEFVYGDMVGFALLEAWNSFPAQHGENSAETNPEL
jgi:hypothetical protein